MKRLVLFAVCLSLVCLLAVGCGSSAKSMDITAFADSVIKDVDFGDDLLEVPEAMLSDYYTIANGKISESKVYVSGTGATASELAVFKCSDANAAKDVKSAVETRVSEQISAYENYRPDEKFRLENAFIAVEGEYVVFAVSNDNAAVEKLLGSALK